MQTRNYRLPQGATVSIKAAGRLLEEVAQYLGPHYEETATGSDWRVVETCYGRDALGPGTIQSVFGEQLELAPVSGDAWLIRHEGSPDQVWYLDQRRVEVVVTPEVGSYVAAQGVYAAVRQIGLREAACTGLAVLHAAAVDMPSGGILLCGEKGAGKTTLALVLLAQGAAYMASDRVMIWRNHGRLRIAGWPGSFRLSPEAIDLALDGVVASRLRQQMRRASLTSSYWFDGKFRFPPGDLLDLGGWCWRTVSTPRLLVELDPTIPADDLEWLSVAELEQAWRRHLVPGQPLPAPVSEVPPNPLPAEIPGFIGARIGRSAPVRMAYQVLALARETA